MVTNTGDLGAGVRGIGAGQRYRRGNASSQRDRDNGHPREYPKSDAEYCFHCRTNGGENRPKLRKHSVFLN